MPWLSSEIVSAGSFYPDGSLNKLFLETLLSVAAALVCVCPCLSGMVPGPAPLVWPVAPSLCSTGWHPATWITTLLLWFGWWAVLRCGRCPHPPPITSSCHFCNFLRYEAALLRKLANITRNVIPTAQIPSTTAIPSSDKTGKRMLLQAWEGSHGGREYQRGPGSPWRESQE